MLGIKLDVRPFLDRVSQDDGNTVLTLAQWQAQGHETHSFIAADTDLWVSVATADMAPGVVPDRADDPAAAANLSERSAPPPNIS